MTSSRLKIIMVLAAIVVGAGLWYADKKGPEKTLENKPPASTASDQSVVSWPSYCDSIASATASLSGNDAFTKRYSSIKSGKGLEQDYDSVAVAFLRARLPMAAAGIYLRKASSTNFASDWAIAAESFYKASHFSDSKLSAPAMKESVAAFRKACELDAKNLKYKTQLGSAIVESTNNPMEGITILREVVSADSTYVDAHIQLALFAIQSGQHDKAISRLQRVIKMRPDFAVAHLYMGQAFQQAGKITEAIAALEKYRSEINDPALREEVQKYIEQLKKPSNS
jgi:tetratricopeptide (TPR) repeat protein